MRSAGVPSHTNLGVFAAAGPPWTLVTIGALPATGLRGASSHPWMVKGPFCQVMLRAATIGAQLSLSWVIWRGLATAPAKIDGARSKSWLTKATELPFSDRGILAPPAEIETGADQSGRAGASAALNGTIAL